MRLYHVSHWSVLVSGVAIFILGGLWYSPVLFAKRWMQLTRQGQAERPAFTGSMPLMYFQAFICALLTAWVLAFVMDHFTNLSSVRGALIGAFCWVGFTGATSYAGALFSLKPKALWL